MERFDVDGGALDHIATRDSWGPKTAAVRIMEIGAGGTSTAGYAIYDDVRDPPADDLVGESFASARHPMDWFTSSG